MSVIEIDGIPRELFKSIESIAKKEGYVDYNIVTSSISADGISFLAKLYAIDVTGKTKEGDKETKLFVKYVLPCAHLDSLDLGLAYLNEAFFYNEVANIVIELQEDANIPEKERFKTIKSYGESNEHFTILENIDVKGYKTCNKTYVMSLETSKLLIKELAKFHALSFVIEKKKPIFYEKIKKLTGPFKFNEECSKGIFNVANVCIKHLTKESKEKIERFMPYYVEKWEKYMRGTNTVRCMSHGDCRLNNFLMKYKDGEIEDQIMLDYQWLYYGCPVDDFLFFIFTGTDQKFRANHLEYLNRYYYENFSKFLQNFNIDSEEVYSRRQFEKDYKERLDYGLISAFYFLPFTLAADDDVPDLGEKNIAEMEFKVHDDFPERIQGIVDDFISWGYL